MKKSFVFIWNGFVVMNSALIWWMFGYGHSIIIFGILALLQFWVYNRIGSSSAKYSSENQKGKCLL